MVHFFLISTGFVSLHPRLQHIATLRGLRLYFPLVSTGFVSLHPRLQHIATLRGLKQKYRISESAAGSPQLEVSIGHGFYSCFGALFRLKFPFLLEHMIFLLQILQNLNQSLNQQIFHSTILNIPK